MPYEYWEETDDNILSTSCYIFDEDWIRDNDGRELVFQIINHDSINFPQEIAKLQFFYHLEDYSTNVVVSDDVDKYIPAEKFDNLNGVLFFEDSNNLPDWETLESFHNVEYSIIKNIIQKKYLDKKDYEIYEIYNNYVEEILGHKNHISFIGGNLNQFYHLYLPKNYLDEFRFIMQVMTDFGNCDIIYLFQNRKDNKKFESFIMHS